MLGFMLPNANLQEHYVVLQWLFTKANPDWVILPVCFDDLREDGLRDSLKTLATPETLAAMRQRPFGAKLGGELEGIGQQRGDSQGTTRKPRSRQQLVDEFLERQLSSRLPMWAGRGVAQARCYYALYDFRNHVFGITPSTKRKMIPARREKNMAALMEIIELVRERQVRCLVYVSPTRWDVEPPYELSDYEGWKKEVHALCQNNGVQFADLDRLVPSKQFGLFFGQLDFMHFGPEGHELIGRKVASLIQASP